jgi:hypothetical protein
MVGVSGWPVLSVLNAAGTLNEPTAFEPTQVGNAVINGVAPVNESDGDRAVREGTVDSDADRAIRNQQDDEYRYAVSSGWVGCESDEKGFRVGDELTTPAPSL